MRVLSSRGEKLTRLHICDSTGIHIVMSSRGLCLLHSLPCSVSQSSLQFFGRIWMKAFSYLSMPPSYPVLFPTSLSLHHFIARHTTVLLSELGFSFFVGQRVPNLVLKAQLKFFCPEDGFPGCFYLSLVFSFLTS